MATPPPQHGAGPYHPYAPQQGGPYGPYPMPRQAGPYGPHPVPQGAYDCRLCGAQPAAPVTVRGHQGMLVLMRFLRQDGPFCRDCGLATYRRMSSDTLWQGWWGPLSFFITPFTLLLNLGARAGFRRLAPPAGGFRPALDPGRPLWRRPAALLFLVPALLLFLAVPALVVLGLVIDGPEQLSVGQCVRNEGSWTDQDLQVVSCGSPRAQYKVTARLDTPGAHCAPLDYLADPKYGPDEFTSACLTPLH
ncbi:hypothetical protein AB0I68_17300 [Streptomyces sp. NPDC050448]|uniref:LppU/SCO3897 family protein n=1 Tax=Streptomyces sp. NPDC050448 TaxID=3155404 RepID=UPI00343DDC8E